MSIQPGPVYPHRCCSQSRTSSEHGAAEEAPVVVQVMVPGGRVDDGQHRNSHDSRGVDLYIAHFKTANYAADLGKLPPVGSVAGTASHPDAHPCRRFPPRDAGVLTPCRRLRTVAMAKCISNFARRGLSTSTLVKSAAPAVEGGLNQGVPGISATSTSQASRSTQDPNIAGAIEQPPRTKPLGSASTDSEGRPEIGEEPALFDSGEKRPESCALFCLPVRSGAGGENPDLRRMRWHLPLCQRRRARSTACLLL